MNYEIAEICVPNGHEFYTILLRHDTLTPIYFTIQQFV